MDVVTVEDILAKVTRKGVLEAAETCVCGNREDDYGSPENNFTTIATFWTEYIQRHYRTTGIELTPSDVAAMMILLKVSRIASGNGKTDNWIDIAGYAACGGELNGSN